MLFKLTLRKKRRCLVNLEWFFCGLACREDPKVPLIKNPGLLISVCVWGISIYCTVAAVIIDGLGTMPLLYKQDSEPQDVYPQSRICAIMREASDHSPGRLTFLRSIRREVEFNWITSYKIYYVVDSSRVYGSFTYISVIVSKTPFVSPLDRSKKPNQYCRMMAWATK